jgi:hypothetical protein
LASIIEVSEEPFRPEDGGEFRPDALDIEQHRRRRRRCDLLCGKQHISLSFHRLDLLEQTNASPSIPSVFARRRRRDVAIEAGSMLDPLADQHLALATEATAVLQTFVGVSQVLARRLLGMRADLSASPTSAI